PYGLYRAHGFISAHYAADTGFSEDDLNLFWESLVNMFDHDRSAARGEMNCRGLYIFKHVSSDAGRAKLGCAPAHKLFDLINVERKGTGLPRSFEDYAVSAGKVPDGIELITMGV
ncbi:MAG: type I CRISPR-associated protein Cas7, partial [Leptospiraceae bacterium]|nr:type I CRISPR-associated protein Cas7 [Leptospiraceae bacterium]